MNSWCRSTQCKSKIPAANRIQTSDRSRKSRTFKRLAGTRQSNRLPMLQRYRRQGLVRQTTAHKRPRLCAWPITKCRIIIRRLEATDRRIQRTAARVHPIKSFWAIGGSIPHSARTRLIAMLVKRVEASRKAWELERIMLAQSQLWARSRSQIPPCRLTRAAFSQR